MISMKKLNQCALAALSIFVFQSVEAAFPEHSMSPSRQFVVYGADASVRGIVSNAGERIKANLLDILHAPDSWKTPIIINLQPAEANLPEMPPAQLHFGQTGFGLKLQLDLVGSGDLDAALIERELLRAVLLEMIYRRRTDIAPGTAYVEPPDWLLRGILSLTPGRDKGPLLDALDVSGKTISLEHFLQQRSAGLDSQGRLLYQAHAFALVKLLIDSADGRQTLTRYIEDLSTASNDPVAELRAHFPVLRKDSEDVWRSTLDLISTSEKYELLTFEKTNSELDSLLRLKLAGAKNDTIELKDLIERRVTRSEKLALDRLGQQLMLLGCRGNPLMRPVLREYQQIAELLGAGKHRKIAERLADIEVTRTKLVSRMNEIDDYLNWFEATQSRTASGMFTDFLKRAADQSTPPPRRRDAISVYLDSVETQF